MATLLVPDIWSGHSRLLYVQGYSRDHQTGFRLRAWISLKYRVNTARAWYFRQTVCTKCTLTFFHSLILTVKDPRVWRSPCYP